MKNPISKLIITFLILCFAPLNAHAAVSHLNIAAWKTTVPNTFPTILVKSTNLTGITTNYKVFQLSFDLSAGDYLRFDLGIANDITGTGYVLLDNIVLNGPSGSVTVLNSGFEGGTSDWTAGATAGTQYTFTISQDAYEGSNAAKLTITNEGYCQIHNETPIYISQTGNYTLNVYAKVNEASIPLNTATLNGTSASILLYEASTSIGGYSAYFYFTTYDDDRYAMPYYYDSANGILYYSRELKEITTSYLTDYFMLVNSLIEDYGEVQLNLDSSDQNGNGIDDICEKAKAVNLEITGSWYSWDGSSGSITGSCTRNANNQQGAYSMTITNTDAGNIQISSSWYVGRLAGNIEYERFGGTIKANYTATFNEPSSPQTLISTYEILDSNTIRVNAKDNFPTTTFNRDGNSYSAVVTVTDGMPQSFWPDYQKWLFVVVDSNDTDHDGIPDLSDDVDRIGPAQPWTPLLLLDD